jgi:hypothetical protein
MGENGGKRKEKELRSPVEKISISGWKDIMCSQSLGAPIFLYLKYISKSILKI